MRQRSTNPSKRGRAGLSRIVLLLGGGLLAASCSIPSSSSHHHHGARPSTTTVPLKPVAHGHPVLGVDLVATFPLGLSTIEGPDARILAEAKSDLHIRSVAIVFYLYAPGVHSNVVSAGPGTLSPKSLLVLGREAERLGLTVALRPIIKVLPCTGKGFAQDCTWEGNLKPSDPALWFDSLYRAEHPYLVAADQLNAVRFVVGTELAGVNQLSSGWKSFFHRAQHVAPRTVMESAASIETYFPKHGVTPLLVPDNRYLYYGLDFYPPSGAYARLHSYVPRLTFSNLGPNTPVPQLTSLMEHLLRTVNPRVLSETMIDETGIGAAANAFSAPADWWLQEGKPIDVRVQAAWFSAVCDAVAALHMRGVYFYNINLSDDPSAWPTSNTTFMGRPASMAAFRACAALFARG